MFLINCPYCGERDQSEFSAGGEAHIVRPKQPAELSSAPKELFEQEHPAGVLLFFSSRFIRVHAYSRPRV